MVFPSATSASSAVKCPLLCVQASLRESLSSFR